MKMDYIGILVNRVEIMFILIVLGFILKKCGFLSDELQKEMSVLMLKIITTLAIFSSFVQDYTEVKARGVLLSIGIGLLMCIIEIAIANIVFGKEEYCVENFSIACGNVGFFGLPIVMSVVGKDAAMYAAVVNAFNGIIMWTYGEYILSRDTKTIKIKNALLTTSMIFFVLGLIFFFFQIPLPQIIKDSISSLNGVNAPMCALMIGASLVTTELEEIKTDFTNFVAIVIRLVLVPFIVIVLMKFISNDYFEMKLALVIIFSVPNAASTPVFALRHGRDADKAGRLTCICTLLCVLTMPLMSNLALTIWG